LRKQRITTALAILAFILGLLSIFLTAGVAAIVLGIVILRRAPKFGPNRTVRNLAKSAIAFPVIVALFVTLFTGPGGPRVLSPAMACWTNVFGLGKAMILYSQDHNDYLPTPSQWCDPLTERAEIHEEILQCPGVRRAPRWVAYPLERYLYRQNKHTQYIRSLPASDYAMNPNALTTSGSPRLVVLFETAPGWNQHGGPEILTTDHHDGKGCNVLFLDGHVEFVRTEDLPNLRWTVDAPEPADRSEPTEP
jgi:prepilin-type processing-associated H-X9-DG protein